LQNTRIEKTNNQYNGEIIALPVDENENPIDTTDKKLSIGSKKIDVPNKK